MKNLCSRRALLGPFCKMAWVYRTWSGCMTGFLGTPPQWWAPRMSAHLHENLRSLSKARLDALDTFWSRPALAILPGKRECEFGYFQMFIVFALKCLKPFG